MFSFRLLKISQENHPIRLIHTYLRISELRKCQQGDKVTIKGWVNNARKMKKTSFVDIVDGSSASPLQVVLGKELSGTADVLFGTSVEASGTIGSTPKGQLELRAEDYRVLGQCPVDEGFPFAAKHTYSPDYIREHPHFRSRITTFAAMLRVRDAAHRALVDFLHQRDFLHIHTPILTASDCEGAGEVFRVRPDSDALLKGMQKDDVPLEEAFFDRRAYLSVSGQLHLEAMAHGIGNCFTLGPTFRSENNKSPIHLSEFYMLEVEQVFTSSLTDCIELISDMMISVLRKLLDSCAEDIRHCQGDSGEENLFEWLAEVKEFPVMTFAEAVEVLQKHADRLKVPIVPSDGLMKSHELFLTDFCRSPVFIVDWPAALKPFYMRSKADDDSLVDALDFLVPRIGELIGGSVRENDYNRLKLRIPPGSEWYLNLRRFGGIPTAGFGMGFERFLQFLLNIHNIRDVIPFPRWPHSCML
ncbi:probable asparagine--tRNA ligase, mitochondrial [Phlebotomus argentipes]|uniref:probable asparagine--tRNA ligase, mitochondrial n=1 Tax=Phlebotomus argentipes TaxID=94469 RepID=UPI002892ED83|nr:probable asparagine--tRNA ligase, mitochondrial [Phlebotomus argentipes]